MPLCFLEQFTIEKRGGPAQSTKDTKHRYGRPTSFCFFPQTAKWLHISVRLLKNHIHLFCLVSHFIKKAFEFHQDPLLFWNILFVLIDEVKLTLGEGNTWPLMAVSSVVCFLKLVHLLMVFSPPSPTSRTNVCVVKSLCPPCLTPHFLIFTEESQISLLFPLFPLTSTRNLWEISCTGPCNICWHSYTFWDIERSQFLLNFNGNQIMKERCIPQKLKSSISNLVLQPNDRIY